MRAWRATVRRVALLALAAGGVALVPAAPGPWRDATGPATATTSAARPAPAEVVQQLQAALAAARGRFEARDVDGVLAHVSDRYRSGPLTKPALRQQLLALFGLYDELRATVRLDGVWLAGDAAWVYTTGEVRGRLPLLGGWVPVLAWVREPEVARREGTAWRLVGTP